jgi:hypothetical protein
MCVYDFVIRFEEYRKSLVEHLVDVKIQHWDKSLRELSAKALDCITEADPSLLHDWALPKLVASLLH